MNSNALLSTVKMVVLLVGILFIASSDKLSDSVKAMNKSTGKTTHDYAQLTQFDQTEDINIDQAFQKDQQCFFVKTN